MTFGEAMTEAARGKKVRLPCWPQGQWITFNGSMLIDERGLLFVNSGTRIFDWAISLPTWELYESKLSIDQKASRYDAIEKTINNVEIAAPWDAVKRIVKEEI